MESLSAWNRYLGVVDFIDISLGNLLAAGIVGIEILQFHVENGGLNLVNTAVHTFHREDILPVGAIVSEGTDGGREPHHRW